MVRRRGGGDDVCGLACIVNIKHGSVVVREHECVCGNRVVWIRCTFSIRIACI